MLHWTKEIKRGRERERARAFFPSLPLWMQRRRRRRRKKRRRKSSSINHRPFACRSTTHCYRSLIVVKLTSNARARERRKNEHNDVSTELGLDFSSSSLPLLSAIDDGEKLDRKYLTGIYERIRAEEFRPDTDHVSQVIKFEQTLVGKKPPLIAAHRRLVCYCRLYEIYDPSKREKLSSHQREVYLFNDLLVVSRPSKPIEHLDHRSFLDHENLRQEASAVPSSVASSRNECLALRDLA